MPDWHSGWCSRHREWQRPVTLCLLIEFGSWSGPAASGKPQAGWQGSPVRVSCADFTPNHVPCLARRQEMGKPLLLPSLSSACLWHNGLLSLPGNGYHAAFARYEATGPAAVSHGPRQETP
jgi:hypothetical protein